VSRSRYLEIVAAVDAEFARNRRLHGARIRCGAGCDACCHQVFEIANVDAAHIGEGVRRLEPSRRELLEARAREYTAGRRKACPALEDGVCTIYDFRPVMCHKFGMPLFNPDKPERIFACELNFKHGEEIVDPDLIQIQTGIHEAWTALVSGAQDGSGPWNVARAILEAPVLRVP
jgi:Fe-S-cluster containining protein